MFESSSKGAYNIRTVKARKMVILSCGALGTPLLLERSGIGSREVLNRANVPVVADLPGVGGDYQDHHMMLYSYKSRLGPKETLDGINSRGLNSTEFMTNDKILGWNSVDAQCKLRPDEADVANLGPKFQNAWDKEFKSYTNKPMTILSAVACYPGDPSAVPAGQYFAIAAFSLYPFSRGHIHITGPKLEDKPDFDLGFFADEEEADIKKHIWTYKKQREIVRRMEVYGGEIGGWHPPFPTTSKAACIDTECPLGDVPDIEYTVEDDQIIEKWVREHVDTTWHSLGTCKMAPRVELGVVDPSLNVYGVERLKVADLSIPPSNIGANTNSTAMAIGEKAADIFARELGLA
ncbi:GMC oxidoreductase-domain-containing protein [Whalleya microplaca]|nr:GMC oxidoreductase-domain-containing protein [Whalleya microplaca]